MGYNVQVTVFVLVCVGSTRAQLVSGISGSDGAVSGGSEPVGPMVDPGSTGSGIVGPVIGPGGIPLFRPGPSAIRHVGIGYNLLKGNPDGEHWSTGGEDPGTLLTKKILYVDPSDPPQQLVVEHHDNCQTSHGFHLFYDIKSYQDKLFTTIQTSGSADAAVRPYAFMLSSAYQAVKTQASQHHYIFQDAATICNMGHSRYATNLAAADHFPVTREFAASICSLPTDFDETKYMAFIDEWGTHILTDASIGKKTTYRYMGRRLDLFNFVVHNWYSASCDDIMTPPYQLVTDDVSIGGPLDGYPASYVIDIASFQYRYEYKYILGAFEDILTIGDMYSNDVIAKTLVTIDMALNSEYWQRLPFLVSQGVCNSEASGKLTTWQNNIIQALKTYPGFKGLTLPADSKLAMPLTWPYGTYALPKPASGCPQGWVEGTRTQLQSPSHSVRPAWPRHLAGTFTQNSYTLGFCVKEDPSPTDHGIFWPQGDYCIFKSGTCPQDFTQGWIQFDDAGAGTNTGVVPDGIYDGDTRMFYCCRNDSVYSKPRFLPSDVPFYLFKNQHGCQKIQGMTESDETLTFYNVQNPSGSRSALGPVHPATDSGDVLSFGTGSYILHYCYYQKSATI